jgi:hypothetical protein
LVAREFATQTYGEGAAVVQIVAGQNLEFGTDRNDDTLATTGKVEPVLRREHRASGRMNALRQTFAVNHLARGQLEALLACEERGTAHYASMTYISSAIGARSSSKYIGRPW